MKKKWTPLLLVLAFMNFIPGQNKEMGKPAAQPATAADPTGLWQKALDVFHENRDWYPEKISILSEILNRHNQPYSVTEMFFAIRMDDKGMMHTELTGALKNGENTTEKMKTKVEIRSQKNTIEITPQKDEALTVSIFDSPFNPERQGTVNFRADGEKVKIFEHLCQRYDFTYRTKIIHNGKVEELDWIGIAWLEEGSGTPVKLEFTLSPLPKRIRSLWTIYLYDMARPGKWVLKKVKMTGHGGFLFIKKRFRISTILSDYQSQTQKRDKN